MYGVKIFFLANTIRILERTFNMGDNKTLCYINNFLLAEVHCDCMHVKIFDRPVFICILKTVLAM